jgi:hypothetical protein
MLTTILVAMPHGGSEILHDFVFHPSITEAAGINVTSSMWTTPGSITEGRLFSSLNSSASRKAYPTPQAVENSEYNSTVFKENTTCVWRTRSLYGNGLAVFYVRGIAASGDVTSGLSPNYSISYGLRPLCNIPASTHVSDIPDENGVYTILF